MKNYWLFINERKGILSLFIIFSLLLPFSLNFEDFFIHKVKIDIYFKYMNSGKQKSKTFYLLLISLDFFIDFH